MKSRKDLMEATELALDDAASSESSPVRTAPNGEEVQAGTSATKSRTAPGTLLAAMGIQRDLETEILALRAKSKEWAGAFPTRKIDANLVDETSYANRDGSHYSGPAWQAFRSEIEHSGGNVQPVLLRPSVTPGRYEIVFGHRRTRACKEAGLPVLAALQAVDDRELFILMDRENRQRADLSPYEQGEAYRKALAAGLYPSRRQLAIAVGRELGFVGRYIAIAELPEPILDAFPSRTGIQKAWGGALTEALQRDPENVLSRAREIAVKRDRTPQEVFGHLLGQSPTVKAERLVRGAEGEVLATLRRKARRRVEIVVEASDLPEVLIERLAATVEKYLKASKA